MCATSSGAVLRAARLRAGLTQAALADRAGVQQSVISAYEADRREPALSTLRRLVEATDHRLDVTAVAVEGPARLRGPIGREVRRKRRSLLRIARRHGVVLRGVFGSVARGEETEDSDVDLLVDLPPATGLFALFRLQDDLERELGCRVDVVPLDGLRDEVRARAERDLIAL